MTSSMKPVPIVAPFKGIITDVPSGFDPQSFDLAQNVLFRKSRIVTIPQLTQIMRQPPDGRIIRGMASFLDALNNWHTLVLTDSTPYFMTYGGAYPLTYNALSLPLGIPNLAGTGLPFAMVEMNQQVFFCNGSVPLLYAEGSSSVKVAGDVPGACYYLAENSSHLIGVNWVIPAPGISGSIAKPFYVQISDANNPLVWTPSSSNSAQIINLIEKGGVPTGVCTLGSYTYVWRQYGANVLWPSGQAFAAFNNEPFTWSNPGWGNYYPYALAVWNQSALMVTHEGEVLLFSGAAGPTAQAFQPMAQGKVKKQLAQDLTQVSGDQVFGFLTDQLGPGYDFVAYHLWIPGLNKAWILNLEEGSWSTATLTGKYPTAFGNLKVQ